MEFGTDIHGTQRITPDHFGDLVFFFTPTSSGQNGYPIVPLASAVFCV